MYKLKIFIHLLLLITTTTLFAYSPPNHLPRVTPRAQKAKPKIAEDYNLWTFDEILDLLDEIESGEFEEKCSEEDLENLIQFLIFLARAGVTSP